MKNSGVFRKDLLSEVIFLLRRLVLKHELDFDATCWTCHFPHKRDGELYDPKKHGFKKLCGLKIELKDILKMTTKTFLKSF